MVVAFFMIKRICNYIMDCLIENEIVKENERCFYYYCVEGLIEVVGNLLITLIIGIVLGKIFETLLFLIIFIPLRSLTGGYHVQNENLCFVLSIALFLEVILSTGYLQKNFDIEWCIRSYIVSLICILMVSPVDCKNKRLSIEKKRKLKKITVSFTIIFSSIFFVLVKLQSYNYSFVISNTTLLIALLLIIGYLKNMIHMDYHSGT